MKKYIAIFLFVFSFALPAPAQSDTGLVISDARWQELTEDVDYRETYKESKKDKKEKTERTEKEINWTPGGNFPKYIVFILLFGVILFFAIRVLNNFTRDTPVTPEPIEVDDLDEIEQKIHEVDLDHLLAEALEKKNYRAALRLNFLIVIKLLSEKEKISWSREKTNWEYYVELKDKLLADKYKELTQNFEQFWYGERPFSEAQYRITEPLYNDLRKKIATYE